MLYHLVICHCILFDADSDTDKKYNFLAIIKIINRQLLHNLSCILRAVQDQNLI